MLRETRRPLGAPNGPRHSSKSFFWPPKSLPSNFWDPPGANPAPKRLPGVIFEQFWEPGTMKKPQKVLYCHQKTRFSGFSIHSFKSLPRRSPNNLQSTPGDPRNDPEDARSCPGEPRKRPRSRREPLQNRSKPVLAAKGASKAPPEASRKRFWSLQALILELFWTPRDLISMLFRDSPTTLLLLPVRP